MSDANHTNFVEHISLETNRLFVEPYRDEDLPDIFAYASQPEITNFLTWEPHKSIDDSRQFLTWVRSSNRNERGSLFFTFGIRLKETGRVIGSVQFSQPKPWMGQLDYALSSAYWNKGLMPEAASAVKTWALEAMPEIVRFQCYCDPENHGSRRVMEKIGLNFECVQKKVFLVKGQITDLAYYAWTK